MTINSIKRTIELDVCKRLRSRHRCQDLRHSWLHDVAVLIDRTQRNGVHCDDEYHDADADDPEGHQDAFLPQTWLLRHVESVLLQNWSAGILEEDTGEMRAEEKRSQANVVVASSKDGLPAT